MIRGLKLFFACLAFFAGIRIGAAHIPLSRLLIDAYVFFVLGCLMAVYLDKAERGFPNEFGIPTRRTHG